MMLLPPHLFDKPKVDHLKGVITDPAIRLGAKAFSAFVAFRPRIP